MTGEAQSTPNTSKGEDWAGEMGTKWLPNLATFEDMTTPIGAALLARADFKPGERVIDIGCGGGGTAITTAKSVAPDGEVLGIDISPDLVSAATHRAEEAEVYNIRFACADAARLQLPGNQFDRLFSCFGSMFFEDATSVFGNLNSLLRRGGLIDLAAWGPPRDNLWIMEMMSVVRNHIDVPRTIPRAPGPFAFEDLSYLREVLTGGGFSSPDIVAWEGLLPIGGAGATPQEAAAFALSSMAAGRVLEQHTQDIRIAAEHELADLFTKHHVPNQGVMMRGKAWLVRASV